MAYFQENETEDNRRRPLNMPDEDYGADETEYIDSDYDDGFDDPLGEDEILTEEERKETMQKRFRFASGAGNLTAVITGAVVILVLLGLLLSMIGFVLNDAERNFTLFQNRF